MALILNIETSSPICSVCLAADGIPISFHNELTTNLHASHLTIFIQKVMQESEKKLAQLDAIAVSDGPGSYTGLRIGASVAKGLCFGLEIPLIALSTLKSMAHATFQQVKKKDALYIPLFDARRMDVYLGVFNSNMEEIESNNFLTITEDFASNPLWQKEFYLVGTGTQKVSKEALGRFGTVIENIQCVASNMAYLSHVQFLKNDFVDVIYYESNYLNSYKINKV